MLYKKYFAVLLAILFALPAFGEAIMPDEDDLSEATLYRVIDGDTAVFTSNNILLTVRLIGVNAPESGALYSKTSSDYLRDKLTGETVYLEKGDEPLDDYGRLLAYVWLGDRTLLNEAILRDGAAAICFFPPNLRYAASLTAAQAEAISENRGLWSVYDKRQSSVLDPDDALMQYIGNRRSKALHKPNCAGLPAEQNRVYFDSYEAAISSGYHECERCFD